MNDAVLEARGLELAYPGRRQEVRAVRGVDLVLRRGEFVAILGPSGSGKSSLLFLLAGLRRPTRGAVRFLGREWPRHPGEGARTRRAGLGFVFQEPFLIPYLTVRENAGIQLARDRDAAVVASLARELGIEGLLDEYPYRLSAGEQQRASVLRALVNDPALVLADEPTAWLDREAAAQVIRLLTSHAEQRAVVLVTHDPSMTERATRTLLLREGSLEAEAAAR